MSCRHCGASDLLPFVDLGAAPPSNAFLTEAALRAPEKWFPLRVRACRRCWLVQTDDFADREELFSPDYAYFSSFSSTWLRHAEQFVGEMTERFGLDAQSHVMEVASNDGYLLQYVQGRGIPCIGIEPTASTARAAREKGLEVIEEFFGGELADRLTARGLAADLTVANNVLAHVPDINGFVAGFARVLKPNGVATFECPHLVRLVEQNQFDTIYHEHYSYLSLTAVQAIFARNGLAVFDVEELATHGGSLRVYAQRSDAGSHAVSPHVARVLGDEARAGVTTDGFYTDFQARADRVKNDFMRFLLEAASGGQRVAAYGAAAKGNTLLNYAGVRPDLLQFVVDRNPAKQGRYMPGSRIPIVDENYLRRERPDYVVLLPWNLKAELTEQLAYVASWGGRFVTAVSTLEVTAA